jgi:hypothetical protein
MLCYTKGYGKVWNAYGFEKFERYDALQCLSNVSWNYVRHVSISKQRRFHCYRNHLKVWSQVYGPQLCYHVNS